VSGDRCFPGESCACRSLPDDATKDEWFTAGFAMATMIAMGGGGAPKTMADATSRLFCGFHRLMVVEHATRLGAP